MNVNFLWIPKTGGSSIREALRGIKGVKIFHHIVASEIHREGFTFAFVRNPWDRVVSGYFYLRQYDLHNFRELVGRRGFEEFVATTLSEKRWEGVKRNTRYWPLIIFAPMCYWLDRGIDFVGKFERLEECFKLVCEMAGLSTNLPEKRYRSSSHKNYREYFDSRLREMVGDFYREDIERFGYEF